MCGMLLGTHMSLYSLYNLYMHRDFGGPRNITVAIWFEEPGPICTVRWINLCVGWHHTCKIDCCKNWPIARERLLYQPNAPNPLAPELPNPPFAGSPAAELQRELDEAWLVCELVGSFLEKQYLVYIEEMNK